MKNCALYLDYIFIETQKKETRNLKIKIKNLINQSSKCDFELKLTMRQIKIQLTSIKTPITNKK